jgi:hypothetical protein
MTRHQGRQVLNSFSINPVIAVLSEDLLFKGLRRKVRRGAERKRGGWFPKENLGALNFMEPPLLAVRSQVPLA